MRNLGRIVLGAFAIALRDPPKRYKDIFKKALTCVRSFVDFHLMAQYSTHNLETLGYMEEYLKDFHKHKDVFLEFRAYKKTKKAAKE